jgi:hypothetical protein
MKRNSRIDFARARTRALRPLVWLSLGIVLAVGCGKSDDGVGVDGEDESDQDPSQAGGDDGNNGSSSAGRNRDAGARGSMDAGNPDEHEIIKVEEPDATCSTTSAEAPKVVERMTVTEEMTTTEIKPVAIYLMLDRSSSMVGYCGSSNCNPQSWTQATQAITAFAMDPASAKIDVGLGYFPPLIPVPQMDKAAMLCSGSVCAAPAVPVRPANDNAGLMANSLAGAVPPDPRTDPLWPLSSIQPNFTPMECAIRGMDAFCKAHTMRTGQKCVGVLVTDGVPEGDCNTDQTNLEMVTSTASAAGTQIFTLGLQGANFAFLNRIATAGKTDCTPMNDMSTACDVTTGKDAFIAALNAIRETIQIKVPTTKVIETVKEVPLDCEWKLPDPPEDMKFDPEKVNVRFSATGKDPVTIGRVPTSSDEECKKHPEGWRYDSDDDPKKVLACDKACEMIKTSPGAKINIEFGCKGTTID